MQKADFEDFQRQNKLQLTFSYKLNVWILTSLHETRDLLIEVKYWFPRQSFFRIILILHGSEFHQKSSWVISKHIIVREV